MQVSIAAEGGLCLVSGLSYRDRGLVLSGKGGGTLMFKSLAKSKSVLELKITVNAHNPAHFPPLTQAQKYLLFRRSFRHVFVP